MGAVDRYLAQNARLIMLETVEDVQQKISMVKRKPSNEPGFGDRSALQAIVNGITIALES
jgi:hypothetical protein